MAEQFPPRRTSDANVADRLLEQLPLDLGQRALSIYLWRLIGFFFPVLFGVILFSVALLTTHAVAGNQWMRSALLAFAIMCLGIYAAYLSGRWIRGRLSRIPREVRIILAPLVGIFLLLAVLSGVILFILRPLPV
jgi:hypothetical protein